MLHDLNNYNDLKEFENLDLFAKQVVEGFITGLHKSPFHGFSVEFAEHRAYNNGESVKNIDWKLYGRTDKLFVKRFEEETNLRCRLVLDISSSMYYPEGKLNKLQFSVYAIAALIYLLKKQRDAFGLTLFSNQIEFGSDAKSTAAHQKYLFSELEKLLYSSRQDEKKTSIATALHQIAEQIHKRSLVVIFSDMLQNGGELDAILAALQHLKYKKHEVVIFNVLDHQNELNFNFDNRPYQFIDMETGEEFKMNPAQIKDDYLNAMKAFQEQLEIRCAQYHIDLVPADINKGFYQVLNSYLNKRNRLY